MSRSVLRQGSVVDLPRVMVLVDFHPNPAKALVDGPQALLLSELEHFLGDAAIARETYLKRSALAEKHRPH